MCFMLCFSVLQRISVVYEVSMFQTHLSVLQCGLLFNGYIRFQTSLPDSISVSVSVWYIIVISVSLWFTVFQCDLSVLSLWLISV